MNPDCHLDNDGGPEVIAVEEIAPVGRRQSLWVRVGPVFYGHERAAEPGVWITYQEDHMSSGMTGPVLLTPQVWRELSKAVEERLNRYG